MKNFKDTQVSRSASIRETIRLIDASAMQIALVVSGDETLVGTVTDGDIRRGILAGVSLDEAVEKVMNRQPSICRQDDSQEEILARMRAGRLRHMPVVDDNGRLVRLLVLDEFLAPVARENIVVLMAGGLGARLRPLTEDCPKPMLKIGGRPILETILLNFIEHGFRRFYISVHYKSDVITEYFGDGSRWGVAIEYLRESQKLGTAGALSLLPEQVIHPVLVMNGDLLTRVNFGQLLDFHSSHTAPGTMCVREYDFQVPYGVVRINNNCVVGIDEKPVQRFFVNAGVYVLEPEALAQIPADTYFDMPSLFEKLVAQKKEAMVFPIREYWLDIGRLADYERANGEFEHIFV